LLLNDNFLALLEPLSQMVPAGFEVDLSVMLSTLRSLRLGSQTGKPTREKLMELGLEDAVKDLGLV
jgi:aldehyde:ferredoxin oxidoreductase